MYHLVNFLQQYFRESPEHGGAKFILQEVASYASYPGEIRDNVAQDFEAVFLTNVPYVLYTRIFHQYMIPVSEKD